MAEKLEVLHAGGLTGIHFCVGREGPTRWFSDESDAHLFAAAGWQNRLLGEWLKNEAVCLCHLMDELCLMCETRAALAAARVLEAPS